VFWKLPNIGVPADPLFEIPTPWGPFSVTNTLLLTLVSALIVIVFFTLAIRRSRLIPRPLQNMAEWMLQGILSLCEEVAGKRNGRRFFPWVAAIFFLVLVSNWWSVIPGIETIGTPTHDVPGCENVNLTFTSWTDIFLRGAASNCIKPWLRPPSTDLNFTIALAIVSFLATQAYGFIILGAGKQLGRYFTFRDGPIGFVVGLLELVLEPLRIISLSFRLFGNVFAGDVLLLVIAFLLPVVGPLPFYFLEIFVGFIQAFVFAFLTLIFMTLGTTAHGHEDHEEHEAAEHEERRRHAAEEAIAQPTH